MNIYLNIEKTPESSKDLMLHIFGWVLDHGFKSSTSYFDESYKRIQCFNNKYRSIDDIFLIYRTYYPEITDEEIAFNIFSIQVNEYISRFGLCDTVIKPTMYIGKYSYGVIGSSHMDDKMEGIMSWNDLAILVNIKNDDEHTNFILKNKDKSFKEYKDAEK